MKRVFVAVLVLMLGSALAGAADMLQPIHHLWWCGHGWAFTSAAISAAA